MNNRHSAAESFQRTADDYLVSATKTYTAARSRETNAEIQFGRFRVIPGARQLLADGRPIDIGGRAFDLLTALLSARGTVVTKEDLVSAVWPTTVVAESNLRFQMAALRKALGEDRDMIKTVPGRGYLLTQGADRGAVMRSIGLE